MKGQLHPTQTFCLYTQTVTGITTSRFTSSDYLDDLAPLQSQVPRDRILLQNTRQLRLLQPVPLQQRHLLISAQQHVSRDKLVMGNVHEQIILEEALNLGEVLDAGEGLAGGGGEGLVCDHDAGSVVVGDDILCEAADLLDTEGFLGEELDPDGAAVGGWVGVSGGGWRCVTAEHCV